MIDVWENEYGSVAVRSLPPDLYWDIKSVPKKADGQFDMRFNRSKWLVKELGEFMRARHHKAWA